MDKCLIVVHENGIYWWFSRAVTAVGEAENVIEAGEQKQSPLWLWYCAHVGNIIRDRPLNLCGVEELWVQSHPSPCKEFRAVPYVSKLSPLLRLDFNICHMFGGYDRLMWIAGEYNKKDINICYWVHNHLCFIKTKHQFHIEIKLLKIVIKLIMFDVLPFDITSI